MNSSTRTVEMVVQEKCKRQGRDREGLKEGGIKERAGRSQYTVDEAVCVTGHTRMDDRAQADQPLSPCPV